MFVTLNFVQKFRRPVNVVDTVNISGKIFSNFRPMRRMYLEYIRIWGHCGRHIFVFMFGKDRNLI